MATVFPFRALRPAAELADSVASVPYDVVGRDEARTLAEGNSISFLHVTKPEIDLPDALDDHDDAVYAQGSKALRRLIDEKVLNRDEQECFYLYRLTMGAHVQTGFVLLASVADYDRNIVRKHEHTRPDKENDRVRHMEALQAQSGTVFLCHRDSDALLAITKRVTATEPEYDFVAPDGVAHTVWVVGEPTDIAAIRSGFEACGPIYIADGHHRSASASRLAQAHRAKGEPKPAAEGFLAVSFPASEMNIMDYNRVVLDLAGLSHEEFMARVGACFEVTEGKPTPIRPHQFGMYLDGKWYTLTALPGSFDSEDPVARLDVSILQENLLSRVLGISDPRRDKRIEFVGGIRGDGELERRINRGAGVAFRLHPTTIEELFAIADSERVMPPKSTWFEPKLRDGLFVHVID